MEQVPAIDVRPQRPAKVRCLHCSMPVKIGKELCWSCGRPPLEAGDGDAPVLTGETATGAAGIGPRAVPRSARLAVNVLGVGLLLAVVVAIGAVLVPRESSSPVGRLVDSVTGSGWHRVEADTVVLEMPSRPQPSAPDAAPPPPAEAVQGLRALDGPVRYELDVFRLAAPPDDPAAVTEPLLDQHARLVGPGTVDRSRASAHGTVAFDLHVTGSTEERLVRVLTVGAKAYQLVVAGPVGSLQATDFAHFVDSLRIIDA